LASVDSDRIAEYEMKLMEIDIDTLGIPDTDYEATVIMQSAEFARIVRDLSALGESVKIEVTKEGIRFSADGEAANGSVLLKATEGARERYKDLDGKDGKPKVKKEKGEKPRKRKKTTDADVKMEDADEEVEEDDGGEKLFKPASEDGEADKDDDEEAGSDDEEESDGASKKRKRSSQGKKSKNDDGDSSGGVMVELNQSVNLTFSLKYLVNFSKSTALANTVTLRMSNEVPLLVCYFGSYFSYILTRHCDRFNTSLTRVISNITWHPKSGTSNGGPVSPFLPVYSSTLFTFLSELIYIYYSFD
jgi:proliferating cell nuclear antigen